MSLVNEVEAIRDRLLARMRELEPLVAEYEELRALAVTMGLEIGAEPALAPVTPIQRPPKPDSAAQAATPARAARPKAQAAPRAGEGELAGRIVQAVRANPGQTVAEYASALGTAPAALYRPVRRLTADGTIVKRARQLFPPEAA